MGEVTSALPLVRGLRAHWPLARIVFSATTASGDQVLDRWLFATGAEVVRDVMASGQWVVRDGRHRDEEAIDRAFRDVLMKLV